MVNKKAYIRTIEAIIAIVLILIFIVSIWPKNQQVEIKTPRDIELTLEKIISEFQYNPNYRDCVLEINILNSYTLQETQELPTDDPIKICYDKLNSFIEKNIPKTLSYALSLCSVTTTNCIPSDIDTLLPKENIYTKGAFITTTLKTFNPKTIKIYIWRKA